jgi:dTMP kinase
LTNCAAFPLEKIMSRLRPFSDHRRGLFISIDGPSGAGKSTLVGHLAQLLVADGEDVYLTAEPSSGPIGALARPLTETVTGHALACLYAADRYHHVEHEIRPHLEAGQTVISDRYLPSGLVMQRFDGVDPAFLWALNAEAARPDLSVILEADPEIIARRLAARGAHNRFQLAPGSSHAEAHFYRQATERLIQAGFDVLRVDCGARPPERLAEVIRDRLTAFFAVPTDEAVHS